MFRVAIVEDDPKSMEKLKGYLSRYEREHGEHFEVSAFPDGIDIVTGYRAEYDVIFLDIQMQTMDGMRAAQEIRKRDQNVILVFVTNLAQYAIKGYAVKAMNYVLKPVSYFDFSDVLQECIRMVRKQEDAYLTLSYRNEKARFPVSSLRYVESANHTLTYHTENREYSVRGTMADAEEQLEKHHFFRCNTCYLVNLRYVTRVADASVFLGETELTVSRARKKDFLAALTRYFGEAKP